MHDPKDGYQPTPNAQLERQIMDACVPKSEREWWAFVEIGRLRAEVEALRADVTTLAWIRAEHDRINPRVKCVIWSDRDRNGGQWVEFIDGANFAEVVAFHAGIDAARAAQGEQG